MSIKRVAESVPMDLWVPAAPYSVTALCEAILTIFRDEGGRSDRQKARLMYLVDDYGTDAFAAKVKAEGASWASQLCARHRPNSSPNIWLISGAVVKSPWVPKGSRVV